MVSRGDGQGMARYELVGEGRGLVFGELGLESDEDSLDDGCGDAGAEAEVALQDAFREVVRGGPEPAQPRFVLRGLDEQVELVSGDLRHEGHVKGLEPALDVRIQLVGKSRRQGDAEVFERAVERQHEDDGVVLGDIEPSVRREHGAIDIVEVHVRDAE